MSDKDVITYQNIWEKVWSDLIWWNQAIVELWGHWKVHQFYTIFDTKIFLIVAGTWKKISKLMKLIKIF